MYQAHKPLFLYCVSPVHMGAGTATGLIDNPIQRERHTEYPMLAGSGLKGAVRHRFLSQGWSKDLIRRIFGPDTNASEHAGAISFGDAQLVAFPVRSLQRAFVYVTSPSALGRALRGLRLLGVAATWKLPEVQPEQGLVVGGEPPAADGERLRLEAYEYTAKASPELTEIAAWLADHGLPQGDGFDYFRAKLRQDLVLLPDEDFSYFVRNATLVEPHVRIDDDTGTAADGGLFYTENLPPESLLLAPLMASKERTGDSGGLQARDMLERILDGDPESGQPGLRGNLIQIGGDATTGRGQVMITVVEG